MSGFVRRMGGPVHWWWPEGAARQTALHHAAVVYSSSRSTLLACLRCAVQTPPKAKANADARQQRRAFDRAHRAAAASGYVGRHRAPVPRERVRVM